MLILLLLYVCISATMFGYLTMRWAYERHTSEDLLVASFGWPLVPFVMLGVWIEGRVSK